MPQDNLTTKPASAANLINIESLVNSYNAKLDEITAEMRQHKDMLQSLLDNDPEYQKLHTEVTKLNKHKTIAKQKVLKSPAAASTVDKLSDYQSQLREIKTALSDYLTQYVALSGTSQIEAPNGTVLQIIYSARLVRKKA